MSKPKHLSPEARLRSNLAGVLRFYVGEFCSRPQTDKVIASAVPAIFTELRAEVKRQLDIYRKAAK